MVPPGRNPSSAWGIFPGRQAAERGDRMVARQMTGARAREQSSRRAVRMRVAIQNRLGATDRSVSLILRYGLAIASVAVALLATLALNRPGIRGTPFIPAIMVSAWYGGFGPGLFAVGLSLVAMDYFIVEPIHSFQPVTPDDAWYLLVFTVSAVLRAGLTGT